MGLSIYLIDPEDEDVDLFDTNITHNLNTMASEAGIYKALWRPEEIGAKYAKDIIEIVEQGLIELKSRPEYFEQFSASNGWGTYKQFIPWIEKYLHALKVYPESIISVSR